MSSPCEDQDYFQETRRLEFLIKGQDLIIQRQKLDIEDVQQTQTNKDIEHEQMIQNVTTRMDTVLQDITDFKKEVKQDIQGVKSDLASIKKDIPDMFDNAVNKLLAKMFKYVLCGMLVIGCIIVLAFSRPVILKGIDEVRNWVEHVEVDK